MREKILKLQGFLYKHRLLWAMLVLGLMFCMRRTTPYVVADAFEDMSGEGIRVSSSETLREYITFTSPNLYGLELGVSHFDESAGSSSEAITAVELYDGDTRLVRQTFYNSLNTEQYVEGENYIKIPFEEPLNVDVTKTYSLLITSDAASEEGLLVATNSDGRVWTRASYLLLTFGQRFLLSFMAMSAIIIGLYLVTSHLLKEISGVKPEQVYLFFALVIGVLYLIILPVFKAPDSVNHYVRSYEITKGYLIMPNGGVVDIPKNLIPFKNHTYTYSWYSMLNHEVGMIDMGDTLQHDAVNMALYSPLSYIFQSLGIFLANIFSNNTYVLYYGGSIFNLLGTTAIVYFSIKYIPFGKWTLTALSLLPMVLQQKSGLSVDALTYAMVVATVAFAVYWRNSDRTMTGKDIALMYVILLFLGSCKIVYFVVGVAVLMISDSRFENRKRAVLHKVLAMVMLLGTSVGWILFAGSYLGGTRGGTDTASKVDFILHKPWKYLYIMNKVLWEDGEQYFLQFMGNQLGSTDIYISGLLFIAVLIVLLKIYYEEKKRKIRNDVQMSSFMTLIGLGIGVLVFTSLYIQWTDSQAATYTIEGIQGRYLLPIAPVLMLGFMAGSDQKEEINEAACAKSAYVIACINVIALLVIWGAVSYLG